MIAIEHRVLIARLAAEGAEGADGSARWSSRWPRRTRSMGAEARVRRSDVKRRLAAHKRFHLHLTPTSSSWLNLVQRWFRELTDKALRRGSFASVPTSSPRSSSTWRYTTTGPSFSSGPPSPSWPRSAADA